ASGTEATSRFREPERAPKAATASIRAARARHAGHRGAGRWQSVRDRRKVVSFGARGRSGSEAVEDPRMAELNPDPALIAVLVRRGERVESEHRVAYAVAQPDGTLLQAAGNVERPVFPRSAIKPLQAIALVESGAADRYALSEEELALACASHSGEPEHVRLVEAWLARLGLDGSALECGAHPPLHGASAERLAATGRAPERLHNNCSGKHAGMITLACHLGAPVAGYSRPDHPVQQRIADVLRAMTGLPELEPPAIDGCGVPTFPIPLGHLAVATARFAHPADLPPARAEACLRLQAAMRAHPYLVAGTDRACTEIMTVAPHVLVKTGAEEIGRAHV